MRILSLLLVLLLLTGCTASAPVQSDETLSIPETSAPADTIPAQSVAPDPIASIIDRMTLEERVGQLFLIRCNAQTAIEDITTYHPGGFVLFGADFEDQTTESVRETILSYQSASGIPMLIAVDEEGGTVNRISRYCAFRDTPFPSPRTAFDQGGMEQALINEEEKCQLLSSLGVNVNIGPVCDISTDPNAFMYHRSLGQDAQTTADFTFSTVRVMSAYGIGSVLKHFPGYGNNDDTHTGIAVDSRSLQTLEQNDLLPFASGIDAGCDAILMSHTIVEVLDSSWPVSLSPAVHLFLRVNMGFDGVIITDDLVMEAITQQYGVGEAAVLAVQAGNDLLCSTEYVTQYNAVLDAVKDGRIDMDTLNSAVRNVLEWKMELGLI